MNMSAEYFLTSLCNYRQFKLTEYC